MIFEPTTRGILQREIDATSDSFIAGVRFDLRWDTSEFIELCAALHNASKANQGRDELPRDISQLAWHCGTFLPMWLEQRGFRLGQPFVDYDTVAKLLKRLGEEWFGDDCLLEDDVFARELKFIQSPPPVEGLP